MPREPLGAHRAALLATLAWRNLWRHKRRTAMILFAFALGVWSMVVLAAISRGSLEQQLTNSIRNLTGHIQIHAPGFRDDPVIEHRFPPPGGALAQALGARDVIAWAARVRVPAVIASERESAGVTLVGIEPQREPGLSFIPEAVTEGRNLGAPDDQGLLLGRKLAERLETGLGRRVVLMGQDVNNQVADRGFRVVGIFDTQPQHMEEAYVFAGRATAQALLKMGETVTEIAVMTTDRDRLDAPLARLRSAAAAAGVSGQDAEPGRDGSPGSAGSASAGPAPAADGASPRAAVSTLEIAPWTEVEPLLVLTQRLTDVILVIWYVIVFAAMSFGLVNTLLMAVFERTREFGLLQALGMPPTYIVGQVLVESLVLLGLALAIGNVAAWGTIRALKGGIDLSAVAEGMELIGVAPVIYPAWSAGDLAAANVLVFVLGVAASLYPAWRAARHVPIEAITRV